MRTFIQFLLVLPAVFAAPTVEPKTIPGSYIFTVRKGSALKTVVEGVSGFFKIKPTRTYSFGEFQAFTMYGVPSTTGLLARFAGIESIEPNAIVYASKLVTQKDATWGLGRISHGAKGFTEYVYNDTAIVDTYAYVIDTGIRTTHKDFEGRAIWGSNHVDKDDSDGNGHGTHVAGTIGSKTYGVAKNTMLVAVKVLDATGSGALDGVIAGINWAVEDVVANKRVGKAVANLSLGSGNSPALKRAVAAAVKKGLFLAVAAGNSGMDAAGTSPANELTACTVGATDINDNLASFSNWGTSVDIHAPGVGVLSLSSQSDIATATLSGTSMAAPHVAGLGAYFLATLGDKVTAGTLCDYIKKSSTQDTVNLSLAAKLSLLSPTTKNLAYNGNGA